PCELMIVRPPRSRPPRFASALPSPLRFARYPARSSARQVARLATLRHYPRQRSPERSAASPRIDKLLAAALASLARFAARSSSRPTLRYAQGPRHSAIDDTRLRLAEILADAPGRGKSLGYALRSCRSPL